MSSRLSSTDPISAAQQDHSASYSISSDSQSDRSCEAGPHHSEKNSSATAPMNAQEATHSSLASLVVTNPNKKAIPAYTCETSVFCEQGCLGADSSNDLLGEQASRQSLYLLDDTGKRIPYSLVSIADWSDGSTRVARLRFNYDLPANASCRFNLLRQTNIRAVSAESQTLPLSVNTFLQCSLNRHCVDFSINAAQTQDEATQAAVLQAHLGSDKSGSLMSSDSDAQAVGSGSPPLKHPHIKFEPLLIGEDNTAVRFVATGPVEVVHEDEFATELHIERKAESKVAHKQRPIDDLLLHEHITLYQASRRIRYRFTLHNSARARHENGLWDLGDEGSIRFRTFVAQCVSALKALHLTPENGVETLHADSLSIVQHASGGEHYQSPNHYDADGKVPIHQNGYSVQIKHGNDTSIETYPTKRAEPLVGFQSSGLQVQCAVKNFWQKHPSAIRLEKHLLSLELIGGAQGVQELQGGESTTQEIWFSLSKVGQTEASDDSVDDIDHGLFAACYKAPVVFTKSAVHSSLPFHVGELAAMPTNTYRQALLQDNHRHQTLIDSVLMPEGSNSWIAKREKIDEYGWRHFGDLYADHESQFWDKPRLMASHYNNQYDPLEGFLKQYLSQNNTDLAQHAFSLAQALGEHIYDIDIYKTNRDKDEYNHGLFWHTDHYVEAATSSHRTYSKAHGEDSSEDEPGGGPGGQHCYTGGLRLLYQLTGDRRYKQTVFNMTDWIAAFYDGSGSLLEGLIRIKRYTLPRLKGYGGADYGHRHEYPLDRGVGNYVRALLDSFLLSGNAAYLSRAEQVILNTISKDDKLTVRELDDAENRWFYTVFLQAVDMYFWVADQHTESCNTQNAIQILAAFNHYSRWMLDHENITLDQDCKLDYPTDTWLLQDLRKVHLLTTAAVTDPKKEADYLAKANQLYKRLLDRIEHSSERFYTRSQALLMQNIDLIRFAAVTTHRPFIHSLSLKLAATAVSVKPDAMTRGQLIKDTVQDTWSRLSSFSFKRELDYLRARSDLIARLFGPKGGKR